MVVGHWGWSGGWSGAGWLVVGGDGGGGGDEETGNVDTSNSVH